MALPRTRKALACAAFAIAASVSIPFDAVAAPPGGAKEAATSDKGRAADLFKRSADAYRQGNFEVAITLLDEAYALDPQPILLYNRARAHEGLGHLDEAIAGYERFLAEEPNAPDRGAIEQRLTTLRRHRDERNAREKEHSAKPVEAPTPAPAPREHVEPAPIQPREHSVLPYFVIGAGGAGLAAGTVLGLFARGKNDDAMGEPVQRTAIDLRSDADSLATSSSIAFIVGGVLLVAGAAWWILDHTGHAKTTGMAR